MEDNKKTSLPEESSSANEKDSKAGESEKQKKDFWFVAKIKAFAKADPKRAFYIMMGLLIISIVGSIAQYIYIDQVVTPRFKERSEVNLVGDFEETYQQGDEEVKQESFFELQQVMRELEYYKQKEVLTKDDSIRIKYLIDKYNPNDNEKD